MLRIRPPGSADRLKVRHHKIKPAHEETEETPAILKYLCSHAIYHSLICGINYQVNVAVTLEITTATGCLQAVANEISRNRQMFQPINLTRITFHESYMGGSILADSMGLTEHRAHCRPFATYKRQCWVEKLDSSLILQATHILETRNQRIC